MESLLQFTKPVLLVALFISLLSSSIYADELNLCAQGPTVRAEERSLNTDETTVYTEELVSQPNRQILPECDIFEPFGRWHRSALISLACDLSDRDNRMQNFRANGRGLVATGLTVHSIKWLTNVPRPVNRGEERWNSSFPSGHSAVAFCQAGALGELHSNLRVPLTALAFLVGRSRIRSKHHRISDVIVGGAIGWFWGRYYGKKEKEHNSINKTATVSLVNLRF